jgi:hypothetical protein
MQFRIGDTPVGSIPEDEGNQAGIQKEDENGKVFFMR